MNAAKRDDYRAAALLTGNAKIGKVRVWSFHAHRQRDPHTRAISLVVSRGFGTHVSLTLWWFTISVHRRDRGLERLIHTEIDVLESARRSKQAAREGGQLDV